MTRRRLLRLASVLALVFALLAPSPAQAAAKLAKATCAVEISLQASPGLTAADSPQRFFGVGSAACVAKPSDGHLFQGWALLQTYEAPHGSCTAGSLEGTQLVMYVVAPNGDAIGTIPIVHATWDHGLLQGTTEGESGTLTGALLPLLPSLCLPKASGPATGVELAFELTLSGVHIFHP